MADLDESKDLAQFRTAMMSTIFAKYSSVDLNRDRKISLSEIEFVTSPERMQKMVIDIDRARKSAFEASDLEKKIECEVEAIALTDKFRIYSYMKDNPRKVKTLDEVVATFEKALKDANKNNDDRLSVNEVTTSNLLKSMFIIDVPDNYVPPMPVGFKPEEELKIKG